MARHTEPTPEQIQGWKEWVESRPDPVKAVAKRFDPWTLYKLKTTGHNVTLYSFSEVGTVTVDVRAEFNEVLLHERRVFGINPDDLEETDLPTSPGIALMSNEDVEDNIDALRVMVRPDLWEMNEEGVAVPKPEPTKN
jgi:hypothetical protein